MESGPLVALVRRGKNWLVSGIFQEKLSEEKGRGTRFPDKVACQLFVLSVESDTGQRTLNLLGIKCSYRNGNSYSSTVEAAPTLPVDGGCGCHC